ncbi:MAG: hypothetical protein R3C44_08660 [Chloroflexota bacterium]
MYVGIHQPRQDAAPAKIDPFIHFLPQVQEIRIFANGGNAVAFDQNCHWPLAGWG